MATFDYEKLRDETALPLLKRFGQEVTIVNRTNGTYDPNTLANTKTETTFSGFGTFAEFVDGPRPFTLVEASDRKFILDAKNITQEPQLTDEIQTKDGQILSVKEVMTISPGGVAVFYILRVVK